ncbi:probable ubiquitin-like-specific protease 2B isoform X2 [Alnus glutinosa]|uniref:probable ubiquitin-like-specific protease 2B isoform X2 n=1 Tax=Alnus glutinosa TaxID=3517 RepID=UPI002D79607D|nr:probable ubiquitin-like-specific protease 2B isoform X2 [Alnus glutinosa]
MKSSPRRALEVFDFKEEDELPELAAGKFLGKFKNSNLDNHAILKYEFLECVGPGTDVGRKEVGSIPCVDVDAIDCDRSHENATSHTPLGVEEENFADREEFSGSDAALHSYYVSHEQPHFKLDTNDSRSFPSEPERKDSSLEVPQGKGPTDYALLKSPFSNEPVDVVSDADESMNGNTPSSHTSEIAEDVPFNGCASDHCFGNMDMDDVNMEVVLCPDYVVYRDIYCTGPLLSFSPGCIKISGSNPHGNEGSFDFEWGIDDLIDVRCQWMRKVETVIIKLRVIAKDAVQANNVCSTPGIEELKIAVVDPNWSHKQEAITSLHVKYLARWDLVHDTGMGMDENDILGQRHYFPHFDEAFEDVIYPKGDSDAVSISKRDVDLLQPDTFINDTIIDFYIKYLKNQIQPEERHRFHFFNSFFFRKLADMDKDPTSASDGRAAFLRVRKWTRKVDIFEKDYIFIPVNFNLHWSLIVICHPGEVARLKVEELDQSPKVPCILHMDSIKGSHTGIKNLIQSYLWEEWKERQKETREDISSKFLNLRFVSLELNVNWFPPAEASLKRTLIQRLIFELLENRSSEASSAACSDEDEPSEFLENHKNKTGVEFLSERCSPAIAQQGNISGSQAGQGIEMTLLSASSMSSQCVNNEGLVLKEFLESGASAGSLFERFPSFGHPSSYYHLNGAISPTEEDVDNGDRFGYLPSGDTAIQQMIGITPQATSIGYSSRDFRAETYDLGISVHAVHDDVDSSPETSNYASDDLEVGIIENCPDGEDVGTSQKEETDERKSTPTENMECLTEALVSAASKLLDASAVEGSSDPDKICDGDGNSDQLPIHQENSVSLHDVVDNGEVACDNVLTIGDDQIAESHEQRAAKRLRLTPSLERE